MPKRNPPRLTAAEAAMPTSTSGARRDVAANYGDDPLKAVQMAAFDRGFPTTQVKLEFVDDAYASWRNQEFGFFPPTGLRISAARLYEAGKIAEVGVVTGDVDGVVYVRVSTRDGLKVLTEMVAQHRATAPMDRESATEELGGADRSLSFLKEHNSGVDFSEANDLMNQARTKFKELAFVKGADFRPVVTLTTKAIAVANATVNDNLADRNRRTAKSIGEEERVETEIQAAFAMKNPNDTRNALIDQFKALRAMGGSDPEWKPRDNGGLRQGISNRPGDGRRGNFPMGRTRHFAR